MNDEILNLYEPTGTGMGDCWISFLEMTDLLIQNINACHLSDYLSSAYKMFHSASNRSTLFIPRYGLVD